MMSARLMSVAGRASLKPPLAPRWLCTMPACLSERSTLSRKSTGIPWRAAMSSRFRMSPCAAANSAVALSP
jgi:hypothetical protein